MPPTTAKNLVETFMASFIAAWPTRDAGAVAAFFHEDAVYHNIPLDPVCGRPAIQATVARFMDMGGRVTVDIRHVIAEAGVVMVERTDHFVDGDRSISLPMAGVFEVADGEITAWRDYFDMAKLALGQANGT